MTIQPLNDRVPITNPDGTPTQYFLRQLQERGISVDDKITAAEAIALINEALGDHTVNAGTGLSGGGTLISDPTLALNAGLGDLNDVDFSTPPTDGQVIAYDAGSGLWLPADQSGGGGGGGGWTLIDDQILVSNSATISFATIPQDYEDLILLGETRSTGSAAETFMQFNGDTGANYYGYYENRFGNNTYTTAMRPGGTTGSGATAGARNPWRCQIFNYTDTTRFKTALSEGVSVSDAVYERGGGNWQSNSAITDILLTAGSSTNFAAGSRVRLYGRKSSSGSSGGRTAYVDFTGGSPPTLNSSSGIASVTRTATGRYRVTFTTAMADTYYSMACSGRYGDSTTSDSVPIIGVDRRTGFGKTTTYVDITAMTDAAVLSDNISINIGFFA